MKLIQKSQDVSKFCDRNLTGTHDVIPKEKFENYQILEEIGRGGMGIVYKAHQKGMNRTVALKILRRDAARNKIHLKRFFREAKATAKLDHPNIVSVYTMGTEGSIPYFVMEYIQGCTFQDYIDGEKASLRDKMNVLIKISHALQHAHEKKILHRDLKPSNILLSKDNKPFLTDFGLVKFLDNRSRLTKTDSILGTPSYMSPEQLKNKAKMTPASDVFSMGVILYQILSNRLPFLTENMSELYLKIAHEYPPLPSSLNPETPKALESICLKAMSKSPRFRYSNMKSFASDLENFYSGKPVQAHKFYLCKRITRYLSRKKRRLAGGFLLFSILLLALIFCFGKSNISADQRRWDEAQSAYQKGKYSKALKCLERIQKKRQFSKISYLRKKIWDDIQKLKTQIKEDFSRKKYRKVLKNISNFAVPSKDMLKLQAQSYSFLKNSEEMRISLARLNDRDPSISTLKFMGKKSLQWGYFHDAHRYFLVAWKKSRQSKSKFDLQANLARALLYMGKDAEARKLYRSFQGKKSSQIFIDMATLAMHEEDYPSALKYIKRIKDHKSSIIVQSSLLQIYLLWKMEAENLEHWSWLYPRYRRDVSSAISKKITKKLAFVQERIEIAKKQLLSCSENYLSKIWKEKLKIYEKALYLEKSMLSLKQVEKKKTAFLHLIQSSSFSPRLELFAKEILIRFLIRHKIWREAVTLCDDTIYHFPWAKNLYMLRGICRLELHSSGINDDFLRSLQLQRLNFHVLENISELFFRKMAQEEFYQCSSLLFRYLYGLEMNFPVLLFRKLQGNLRYHLIDTYEKKSSSLKTSCKSLLNTALKNDSLATRNLAIEILASHSNLELQTRIKNLLRIYSKNSIFRKRLWKLIHSIRQHARKKRKQVLRKKLLQYRVFESEKYAKEIYHMKNSLVLLKEILLDPKEFPMVQMLAAKMILALKSHDAFFYLDKIAKGKIYPQNLLSAIAIRSSGIAVSLPKNIERISLFCSSGRLHRILLALYLNPYLDKKLYKRYAPLFIESKDELIVLCLCYNLRRYERIDPFLKKKVQEKLQSLSFSKDIWIRSLTLRISWRIGDLAQDEYQTWKIKSFPAKCSSPRLKKILKIQKEYWRNSSRQNALLKAFALKNNPRVQLAALLAIMEDARLRKFIAKSLPEDDSFLNQLTKQLISLHQKTPNAMVRYWSMIAIGILDRSNCQDLLSSKTQKFPLLIRTVPILGKLLQQKITPDILKLFDIKNINPKNELERRRIQLSLIINGYIKNIVSNTSKRSHNKKNFIRMFRFILPSILIKLKRALNSKDPAIVRSSLTGLLWMGNRDIIDHIYPYLRSSRMDIRRAAAATIAYLTIRYQPDKLLQLQEILLDMPLEVRKSAAYGYYNTIQSYMVFQAEGHGHLTSELAYREYLQYFQEAIQRKSQEKINLWLLALKSADALHPSVCYRYESALILKYLKDFRGADSQIQKALELTFGKNHIINHDKFRCLLLRSKLYFEMHQYKKALSYLRASFSEYLFDAKSHLLLAKILKKLARRGEKKALWRAYLCSHSSKAWFKLIDHKIKNAGYSGAFTLAEYSSTHWKSANIEAQDSYSSFVEKSHKRDFYKFSKKMLKDHPLVSEFHYFFAKFLQKKKKYQKAKQHFLYAYLCRPETPKALWKLAAILAKKRNRQAVGILKYICRKFSVSKEEMRRKIRRNKHFLRLKY